MIVFFCGPEWSCDCSVSRLTDLNHYLRKKIKNSLIAASCMRIHTVLFFLLLEGWIVILELTWTLQEAVCFFLNTHLANHPSGTRLRRGSTVTPRTFSHYGDVCIVSIQSSRRQELENRSSTVDLASRRPFSLLAAASVFALPGGQEESRRWCSGLTCGSVGLVCEFFHPFWRNKADHYHIVSC